MPHYPFAGDQPYARNQWYLAAWSDEVKKAPLGRTILGEEVVLYRASRGDIVALAGICPHRFAPLALGRVAHDTIQCPYHGASFDSEGRCLLAPLQARPPPNLRIRPYAVIEQAPCIWIWPGDPDQADLMLLPDGPSLGLGNSDWRADRGGPVLVKARAQIILENLFDQSHIDFVHPGTLKAPGPRPGAESSDVFDSPSRFGVTHQMPTLLADEGVRAMFPDVGDYITPRLQVELLGVSLINSVGSHTFSTEEDGSQPRALGRMNFVHALTPQTATTTHYFSAVTRDFAPRAHDLSDFLTERNTLVMQEDIVILEAIEAGLQRGADTRREVSFGSDAAAMQVRRRMERIIDGEKPLL